MKIKKSHKRDFWAYVRFNRRINGRFGNPIYFCPGFYNFSRGTISTIRCFVEYDSTGKMSGSPKEPRLLKLAMDGKKLVNWHIEQWAEGCAEGILVRSEIIPIIKTLPEWALNAFLKQEIKILRKKFV